MDSTYLVFYAHRDVDVPWICTLGQTSGSNEPRENNLCLVVHAVRGWPLGSTYQFISD